VGQGVSVCELRIGMRGRSGDRPRSSYGVARSRVGPAPDEKQAAPKPQTMAAERDARPLPGLALLLIADWDGSPWGGGGPVPGTHIPQYTE